MAKFYRNFAVPKPRRNRALVKLDIVTFSLANLLSVRKSEAQKRKQKRK